MNKLPIGWVWTELGKYIYVKNGYAFKSSEYIEPKKDTIPVIRISDIQDNQASIKSAIHVNQNENARNFIINNGDLLIAMSGATTGKIGVFNENATAYQNQRVGNLKLINEELGNSIFRNYLIQSLSDTIFKIAYGGAQPNISSKAIENITIPLPPKAEQDHIATLLDNHLSQVATIRQKLNAILPIIKQFRQSVLAQAVSGKLTEDWRNSSDLSEWQLKKIQEIAQDVTYGYTASSTQENTGVKLVRITDLQNNDINWDTVPFCEISEKDFQKYQVKENDLLFARTGATVGKSHLVQEVPYNAVYASYLIRVRLKNNYDMKYISYYFQSPQYWNDITELSAGIGQPNVNGTKLKNLQINLPPLSEQQQIVAIVERLFAVSDTIETQVNEALERVGYLTQSILHQAFMGNLSADWRACNAELITGEHSGEALLEKIKSQKIPKKKKG